MTPCPCGAVITDIRPIGLQRDLKDRPALILYNCPCGTTKAIPVSQASPGLLAEAQEIDFARRVGEGL